MKDLVVLFLVAPLLFAACIEAEAGSLASADCELEPGDPAHRGDSVSHIGTIEFQSIEGGFFGIVADDGSRFDPVNLCEGLQEDGLRVSFKAWELDEMGSVHMWGTIVELEEIQKA